MKYLRKIRFLAAAASPALVIAVLSLFNVTFAAPGSAMQTSKGVIVGTITDPNKAVIAAATVKITNISTNVSRETVTSSQGAFRIDAVDPGSYRLEVGQKGFKTAVRDHVGVAASQTVEVLFELEIGSPSEVINVTIGNAVILQTEDGARINTITSRQITDLPVPNLNPVELVFTLPGVISPGQSGGFVQGTEFSINGLRPRANNQLVDGLDNNDNSITGQFYQPVLRDGYSEVTVLSSNFSAEYGRGGGAVINVITRSGSNDFHGSAYDVINNAALNSLSPGQKAVQSLTEVPEFTQNTFGFSLGGPIKRDKLFFFGTFQGDLARSGGVTSSAVVPTVAGFNQLRALFPAGASPNLDRYLSLIGGLRGTTAVRNVPLGGGRPDIEFGVATRTSAQPVNDYQYLARVDWTPTGKDSFSFRYLADDQIFSNQFPQLVPLPGFEIDVPSLIQNFFASHTRDLGPRVTNEFRFGYGRFNVFFGPRNEEALNGPTFTIATSGVTTTGLPATFPQGRIFNNYQFQDTLTYTAGNHTLRAGADILVQRARQFIPINLRGTLTFTEGGGFPAFGNFLDGFSGTQGQFAAIVFGEGVDRPDTTNHAYFINDSWRVRPNLTLNLGLRYENYGAVSNILRFPAFAGFNVPLDMRAEQQRDNNNFAPRLSFAYSPRFAKGLFGEDKTVIRGGFAVNYDVFFNNILSNTAAASPNVFGSNSFGTQAGGRGFANAGVNSLPPTGTPNPQTAMTTIVPGLLNPQTYLWNFGAQRELAGLIVDAAYVGSRGARLFVNEQLNPGFPGTTNANGRLFASRGSVLARTNGGDSIYHALQTRVERGLSDGLLFRYSYTFSKAIDNVNSEVFATSGGTSIGSDPFNRRIDRSIASFDAPHRNVFTFLYDIPSPARQGFLPSALGGFTLSGTYRIQSGAVETPFVGGIDLNGDLSAFNDRPAVNNTSAPANSVAIAAGLLGVASSTGFVDANGNPINLADAFFVVDRNIRTGVAGRNTLRAPRFSRLDLSLNRSLQVPFTPFETDRFDIRVDFFNALNHPSFTWDRLLSDGDVLNPFFNQPRLNDGGTLIGNAAGGRIGRIQLRYSF